MTSIPGVLLQLPEGSIRDAAIAGNAAIQTSKLEQRVLQREAIALTNCRVWDALITNLPGTSASDDLALLTGTPGTDAIKLSTGDVKTLTVPGRKAAFEVTVPDNYDEGATFNIQIMAGMQTTVSDGTATLDLQVFKMMGDNTISADLYAGAAQTINNLTASAKVFPLTASISPGDNLLCIATIAVTDTATATAVIANIYGIYRQCDTRG